MTPPHREDTERPVAALLVPDILTLLDESPESVALDTAEMHPADLADVAEAMPEDRLLDFLLALPTARAADVLEYLDEERRTELFEGLTARQAAALVSQMQPDDRADVLEEMEDERAEEILAEIPAEARAETEALLQYEPDSAGGRMTTEFVSAPETMTVEEALRGVRTMARSERREAFYTVYTTDVSGRLLGVMSLRELLAAPEGGRLADIAWTEVQTVSPHDSQESVARIATDYDLVAVPVVDEDRRLLGVVTVDDVIDAIQEEQTEDVQKLGGMEALDEPYMQISFLHMLRKRAGWLSILMVSEMFTTSVLQHYDVELRRAAVLILFVPLVMSSGGNSGSQSTSLITRAMALGEVTLRDWWRVAIRELPSGIALGTILGVIAIVRIFLWQQLALYDYTDNGRVTVIRFALTVAFALVGIVTFGSLTGSMLPFLLKRLGFDPASASAPLVATLVDMTGLAIYFTTALLFLRGTLL
jgi:magnesium transporter